MRSANPRLSFDAKYVSTYLPPKGLPVSGESTRGGYRERKIIAITNALPSISPDVNPNRDVAEFFVPSSRLAVGVWVIRDPNYFFAAGTWSLSRYTIRDGIQTAASTIFTGRSLVTAPFYEIPNSSVNSTPGYYRATMSGPLGDNSAVIVAWEPNQQRIEPADLDSLYAQCNLRISNEFT